MWEAAPEAQTPEGQPSLDSFFFVATPGTSFVGATTIDGDRVAEMIPILSQPIFAEPGTFGFMTQPSLFGRGVGGGRTIELNVSGQDLNDILGVGGPGGRHHRGHPAPRRKATSSARSRGWSWARRKCG